jgi:hypothetical protein
MHDVRDRSLVPARCALLLTAVATLGCTSPTVAADTPVVPLLGASYTFACGAWQPATPPVQRTLLDVRLSQIDTARAPAPDLLAELTNAGARVVYRYHGPQVRVELDVGAVPALHGLNFAESVADPDVRDVSLLVMLAHDLTNADIGAVEALGGRVTRRFDAIDGYAVVIDDAKVPAVRALRGVTVAGFDARACLG